jgi:PA14 domain-containing protein/Big-like domain-containing protein
MRSGSFAATAALAAVVAAVGCQQQQAANSDMPANMPAILKPAQPTSDIAPPPAGPRQIADLTNQSVAWGMVEPTIIDTRSFGQQIVREGAGRANRAVKEMLPEHTGRRQRNLGGEPNNMPVGGLTATPRTVIEDAFPGIDQTGWVPPDPSLAVGPNHIVTTVNQDIAFLLKDGTLIFQQALGSPGNPGFFEDVGAGNFTFDPKVFFDHESQRFVVVSPEVYGSTQAYITIAVSDDDNPLGIWFKYRTDAVIQVGSTTFWWDYPGFGFDSDAFYVTSNLFGLNQGGWGGVGYRIFDKASMLNGSPVIYATMRDGTSASVQVAQHFGNNIAPFFVSVNNNSSLRVQVITNPLTDPLLVTTSVTVPSFNGPGSAPSAGGNSIGLIDLRMFNVHWRDGNLYATHGISAGGKNVARWYHMDTGTWPFGGSVSLVQSGNIDPGGSIHTFFPAIYSNALNEVAMVIGASSSTDRISVNVTGRLSSDPAGTMGPIIELKNSTVNTGGRWGDYYDIAIDPVDDRTFWVIGEYGFSGGWNTWISSFQVSDISGPFAVPDSVDFIVAGESLTVDVIANDGHTAGEPLHIVSFDAVTAQGGSVALSAGTGPDGRDELSYTAPAAYSGPDSFNYTIGDDFGETADSVVNAVVYDPADIFPPATPPLPLSSVAVSYYEVGSPSSMPDYDAMTPYATDVVPDINYTATGGNFATSGRQDNVGARFEGYVSVPELGAYRFYTTSDDGSLLYIDGQLVVDNDGNHAMTEQWGVVALEPGLHAIRVDFYQGGGSSGLIVEYEGPGVVRGPIPAGAYRHDNPCPADLVPPAGLIDFFDVQVYLGLFSSQNPLADINYDGNFDFFDIQLYLLFVSDGCP